MAGIDPIRIDGLAAFTRDLRKMDAELPKQLRIKFNEAAELVAIWVRTRVPRRTGAARRSVKPRSTRTAVRLTAGGPRAPYFPWLDFGGRVGRNRSVSRRFISDGRYLYPGYRTNRTRVRTLITGALAEAGKATGIEVT